MKLIFTVLFSILTLLNFNAQDVFTVSPNQPITVGTQIVNLPVSNLNTIMDSNYGLEKVCIDISHQYLEDLTIILVSPTGLEILISEKIGGNGTMFDMTCLTGNTADPLLTSASPPYNGSYRPQEQLGILNNGTIQADGTWQLKIIDDFSFFDGTIHSFSITFSSNPAVIPSAPNDNCNQAISITVNPNYTCISTTTGNIVDANPSQSIPSCNISNLNFDDDIWFKFTANSTAQSFEITNIIGTSNELIYQVLEGDCQSLTEIYCDEGLDNIFEIKNLIAGDEYLLRIASKSEVANQNISFDICIKEGIPDPPINDECINAIEIANSGGCINVTGDVSGATPSSQSQSCPQSGTFSNDIWFYFVANQTNLQLKVSEIVGVTRDLDFQISHGNCSNPIQDFCFFEASPGSTILIAANNLILGETYFLRVATFNGAPKNTSFKVCIQSASPPPSNNDCNNAIALVPDDNNCNLISGTLSGANGGASGLICDNSYEDFFDDDVWFNFTATKTAHSINLFNIIGSSQDLIFEIYSGNCSSLNSIHCQDLPDDRIDLDGLSIGQTYFVRIASYLDLVQNTTFDICVGKNNLLVTNTLTTGEGSLRFAISNAVQGDTIKFASNINDSVLNLDSPAIIIDKELVLHNDYGDHIKIGNSNSNNTDDLLIIQGQLYAKGLQFSGTSAQAMKIRIESTGDLLIYQD